MTRRGTAIEVFKAGEQELVDFPYYGEEGQVHVWQGVGGSGIPDKIGVGFATYRGRFDWVLAYDVAYYFLDGSLDLTHDDVTHTAGQGDIMFIPRGVSVVYHSPAGCRIFWVSYPGNWEEISDFSVPSTPSINPSSSDS